jgi:hypothetical protein
MKAGNQVAMSNPTITKTSTTSAAINSRRFQTDFSLSRYSGRGLG